MPFTSAGYTRTKTFANSGTFTPIDLNNIQEDLGARALYMNRSVVTALPTDPVDGQEIYYLANNAQGNIWHLKYRSASASNFKWEFVGGTPIVARVPASEVPVTANVWVDLTTIGPEILIPLDGQYMVTAGAGVSKFPSAAAVVVDIGVAIGSTNPIGVIGEFNWGSAVAELCGGTMRLVTRNNFFKDNIARLRYLTTSVPASPTFINRFIEIYPARVG